NLSAQEMTNDFIVEKNLCRFSLVTQNSNIADSTTEVGFVFCFLHTAFDGKNIFTIPHDFIKEFERTLISLISHSVMTLERSSDLVIAQELKEGQVNNLILPKYQTFYSNLIFFKEVIVLFGWLIFARPRNVPSSSISSSQTLSQLQSEKSEQFQI